MATPYFPDDLGDEELDVPKLRLSAEAYEQMLERARRLGIDPPNEVMTYALGLFIKLTTEMEKGTRLLLQRGGTISELSLTHPTRPGQPLVAQPDFSPRTMPELVEQRSPC